MSLSIERKRPIVIDHSRQPSVRLRVRVCVCVCVCPVHCGKTAERVPFGMVGQMGPGIRQVVGFGDRSTGRGNFGGECEAPHCNQWGLCGATRPCSQITLGRLVLYMPLNQANAICCSLRAYVNVTIPYRITPNAACHIATQQGTCLLYTSDAADE